MSLRRFLQEQLLKCNPQSKVELQMSRLLMSLRDNLLFYRKVFKDSSIKGKSDTMKCEKIEEGVLPTQVFGPIPTCPPKPCGCINI